MFYIFFLLFSTALFASSQWEALYHNNTLPITAYPSGEQNLIKEEEFLLKNQTKENICNFPARYTYLKEKYDLNISFEECSDLQNFIKDTNSSEVSLVFVSSFLSSPSSFMGHGFIKFNKNKNPFFSQTISYSAEVPSSTGFFSLIKNGVSGKFEGTISVAPYFKLLETYNIKEQRDIEEYNLKLSEKERNMLMLHSYELLLLKNKYKFFTNNCATELLWLLNVSKPNLEIMKEKSIIDTPYSVVKTSFKLGLIKDSFLLRESMLSKMNNIYFNMTEKEQNDFLSFKESKEKSSLVVSENVILLTNLYYDYMFKKFSIVFEDFNEVKNLSAKIKLKKPEKQTINLRNESKIELTNEGVIFSPVLLDRVFDYNSVSEITLEFLKTNFEYSGKLNSLYLFNIQSNNLILPYKKDISWKINSSIKRDNKDNLLFLGEALFGGTIGYENLKFYSLLGPNLNTRYSDIKSLSGVSFWIDRKIHIDYSFYKGIFYENLDENKISISFIEKNYGFNLSYEEKTKETLFGVIFKF